MNEIPAVPENFTGVSSQEVLLGEVLENQQKILENQKKLLSAERNRRIWGIIKMIVLAILIIVPLFFLPAMISSMMGGSGGSDSLGGMNLQAILGNPDALEQLLMGQ